MDAWRFGGFEAWRGLERLGEARKGLERFGDAWRSDHHLLFVRRMLGNLREDAWKSVQRLLEVSWEPAGASWEALGTLLEALGSLLEALGASWAHLVLHASKTEPFMWDLTGSWSDLESSWECLGRLLGGSWEYFASFLGDFWSLKGTW